MVELFDDKYCKTLFERYNMLVSDVESYLMEEIESYEISVEKIRRVVSIANNLNVEEHIKYPLLIIMFHKAKQAKAKNDFEAHEWRKICDKKSPIGGKDYVGMLCEVETIMKQMNTENNEIEMEQINCGDIFIKVINGGKEKAMCNILVNLGFGGEQEQYQKKNHKPEEI